VVSSPGYQGMLAIVSIFMYVIFHPASIVCVCVCERERERERERVFFSLSINVDVCAKVMNLVTRVFRQKNCALKIFFHSIVWHVYCFSKLGILLLHPPSSTSVFLWQYKCFLTDAIAKVYTPCTH
jgi:hypothetical protein